MSQKWSVILIVCMWSIRAIYTNHKSCRNNYRLKYACGVCTNYLGHLSNSLMVLYWFRLVPTYSFPKAARLSNNLVRFLPLTASETNYHTSVWLVSRSLLHTFLTLPSLSKRSMFGIKNKFNKLQEILESECKNRSIWQSHQW